MKIVELKALRGPNYWSIRREKLIQMKLDLEEMEHRPTNKIEGFRENLEKISSSLLNHKKYHLHVPRIRQIINYL